MITKLEQMIMCRHFVIFKEENERNLLLLIAMGTFFSAFDPCREELRSSRLQ